jgi:chromosome segregation ATPase
VSQLATRVVEITKDGVRDFHGTYEEFVHTLGDDHLDADTVALRARREEKSAKKEAAQKPRADPEKKNTPKPSDLRRLERRRDELTAEIEKAEARVAEIDRDFAAAGFFERTAPDAVQRMTTERERLQQKVEQLMEEWESLEGELAGV